MSLSSNALLNQAESFAKAGKAVLCSFDGVGDPALIEPALYLLGHAVELALKAYLFTRGVDENRLRLRFRHSLARVLHAATSRGLVEFVALSAAEEGAIHLISPFYEGKVLEYPALGPLRVPDPSHLLAAAERLVSGLYAVCAESTAAQRAQEQAPTPDAESELTIERWRGWLKSINNDVSWLHINRTRWRDLVRMVNGNPDIPDPEYAMSWFALLYGTTQSIGIRRQADRDVQSVTLARLLAEIRENPGAMSRQRYMKIYEKDDEWLQQSGHKRYDEFCGEGRDRVDPAVVGRDLAQLESGTRTITWYATKRVAHRDAEPVPVPTYNDLDVALDTLETILLRYMLLVTGSAPHKLDPTPQHTWTRPFTVAWAPPGGA